MLAHAKYAYTKGYIPIVDLKHSKNQYFKDNKIFEDNTWEYYFKQPAGIGLDKINASSNTLIFSDFENMVPIREELRELPVKQIFNPEIGNEYFDYIELNDEIKALAEKYSGLIDDNTLGIMLRGTDYTEKRPCGHYIQPSAEIVIKHAKKILSETGCKKIWLATEDLKIWNKFKKEFPDILIENPQYKFSGCNNKFLCEVKIERKNHFYELGREYLISVLLLSKCKYLLCSRTTALFGVWYFSRGYQEQKLVRIFDIGKYGLTKKITYKNIFQKIFSIKNETKEDKIRKVVTIFGIKLKVCTKSNMERIIGFDRDEV